MRKINRNTLPLLSSLFFITAFFLFALNTFAIAEMLSAKGDKVNMRTGPGIQNKIKWEYGAGFPFEVLKKQDEWLEVKDFEGETGWIHKTLLQKNPQVIVKVNKDLEKTINIRSGPDNESPIVGNAYHGVVFAKLEVKSDWVKVRHESGLTGWIKKQLLWGY